MGLSGFKILILMADTQREVTVFEGGKREGRKKKPKKQSFFFFFSFDIAAQFISSVGNVFIFSKPMDRA